MKNTLPVAVLSALVLATSGCRNPNIQKPIRFEMPDYPTLQKELKQKLDINLEIENLANPNQMPQKCAYQQIKCMIGGDYQGWSDYRNCRGFNDLGVNDQMAVIEKLKAVKKIEVKNPELAYSYKGEAVELVLYKHTNYEGNIFIGKKTLSDSRQLNGTRPENRIYFDATEPTTLKVDVQYQQDTTVTTQYVTTDLNAYDNINSDTDPAFIQALKDGVVQFEEKSKTPGMSCGDSFIVDIKEVFQK